MIEQIGGRYIDRGTAGNAATCAVSPLTMSVRVCSLCVPPVRGNRLYECDIYATLHHAAVYGVLEARNRR